MMNTKETVTKRKCDADERDGINTGERRFEREETKEEKRRKEAQKGGIAHRTINQSDPAAPAT
jgi:hypothetical protein